MTGSGNHREAQMRSSEALCRDESGTTDSSELPPSLAVEKTEAQE